MSERRALVVYYSMTGNSKAAAEAVAARLGANLEVIRTVKPPPRGGFALRFAIGWSRGPGRPWPVLPSKVLAIS